MYYVNAPITFRLNFVENVTKLWHTISKYSIDYVNKEISFEISSYETEDDFKNNKNSFVTFLTLNTVPDLNTDPIIYIWRCLISVETNQFYKSELKKDYSRVSFS